MSNILNGKFDESLYRKVNSQIIERSLHSPDKIYIDIDFFKDFYVGKYLLSPDMNEDKYQRLLKELPTYMKRRVYNHTFIGINPATGPDMDKLFKISPITNFFKRWWPGYFLEVNSHSDVAGKDRDLIITINTYPYTFEQSTMAYISKEIEQLCGAIIIIVNKDPKTLSQAFWGEFDDLFIFKMKEFQQGEGVQEAFTELEYAEKRIYTPQLADKFFTDMDAKKAATYMEIFTQFFYLSPNLISPYSKGVNE